MSISFVVIEYKSLNDVLKFKETNLSDGDELIVSSNSLYSKEKQNSIRKEYSWAKWVFNAKNGGFAYGMNEGLKVAVGDVLVVNTMQATGFTKEEYALRHHGGYLGSIVKGNKY